MSNTRKITGIIFIIIAGIYLLWTYGSLPSAQACAYVNSLGQATCHSSPTTGQWIFAGVIAGLGLLTLAPWWLRWLRGGK